MKLNKAFALRVRELLKEKKMTQYKLAQETGLYHSTMTDILNCKYQTPNFKNMALIIRALGLSMAEFFNSELFNFNKLESLRTHRFLLLVALFLAVFRIEITLRIDSGHIVHR